MVPLAVGRLSELDAVTIDANGTFVQLVDPVPKLAAALRDRGVDRSAADIARAFEVEGRHYRPRSLSGRDPKSLSTLRRECAGVFLSALGADLDAAEFAPAYVGAIEFEPVDGAVGAVQRLREHGLALALVANWDISLHETLRRLRLDVLFDSVVTSAEAGAAKPDPAPFRLALERLAAAPGRALHIGDDVVDEQGARAAGMSFAWAPLAGAVEQLA